MRVRTVVAEGTHKDDPEVMYKSESFSMTETANGILIEKNELIPWHRVRVVYYE
jgi:translation initiation factor 2B subunit (eIF-2B alpha/beta/delta family)